MFVMHRRRGSRATRTSPQKGSLLRGEGGFTLIEMLLALSVVAFVFLASSLALFGGLKALAAAKQRSVYTEVANCVIESLRATDAAKWAKPDDPVGVNPTADAAYPDAYPSAQFEGQDAVITTATSTDSPAPPPAVKVVSSAADLGTAHAPTCAVDGARFPYTIRRWITWTDRTNSTYPPGMSPRVFKRLTVQVEWLEPGTSPKIRLVSTLYPGGLGLASSADNVQPTARMTITPPSASPGLAVTFDATASTDPSADTLTYQWDFGDGQGATGAVVTHAYSSSGLKTAQLTVTDTNGASSIASQVVPVACSVNGAPVAVMSLSPSSGIAPVTINFDASASTDPDSACGDSLRYDWDWGDGTPHGTGVSASHFYTAPGTYTASLTATDSGGLVDTDSKSVGTTPLNCNITSGHFNNPGSNATTNDIKVGGNGEPSQTAFTFHATSNAACTSLQGQIPLSSGSLAAGLAFTEAAGVRTWSGSVSTTGKFNTGSAQTGEIKDTATGQPSFGFRFCVHKGEVC